MELKDTDFIALFQTHPMLALVNENWKILFTKPYFYWTTALTLITIILFYSFIVTPIIEKFFYKKRFLLHCLCASFTLILFLYQTFWEEGYGFDGASFWFYYYPFIFFPALILLFVSWKFTFGTKSFEKRVKFASFLKKIESFFRDLRFFEKDEEVSDKEEEHKNNEYSEKSSKKRSLHNPLVLMKSRLLIFLIPLSLILIFFIRYHLFSSQLITLNDFAIDYYRTWFFITYAPQFQTLFLYSPYFYSGYPEIGFFTPGLPMLYGLFYYLGFSIATAQRIILFMGLIGIYFVSVFISFLIEKPEHVWNKASRKHIKAWHFITGLYIFIVGEWIKLIHNGQMGYYFATLLMIIAIVFFLFLEGVSPAQKKFSPSHTISDESHKSSSISRIFPISKKNKKSRQFLTPPFIPYYSVGLLIGLAFLFNFITGFFLLFFAINYLFWNRSRIKKHLKEYIIKLSIMFFGFVSLAGYWFIFTFYYGFFYSYPISLTYTQRLSINYMKDLLFDLVGQYTTYHTGLFLHSIPSFLWPLFLIGFIGSFKQGTKNEKIMNSTILSVLLFIPINPYLGSFQLFTIGRLFSFVELFLLLSFIRFLLMFQETMKNLSIPKRTFIKSYFWGTMLLFLVFSLHTRFYSPYYNYLYEDDDSKKTELWLAEHVPPLSRYIWEQFPHNSLYTNHTGHLLALVPAETGLLCATGYKIYGLFAQSFEDMCIDGYFFNKPISNVSKEEFIDTCRFYNVQYIVAWSIPMRDFLLRHREDFPLVAHFGTYYIYNNTHFVNSYCISVYRNGTLQEVDSTLINGKDLFHLSISITGIEKNDRIVFSFNDFPSWKVYVNGTLVEKLDTQYISFYSPYNDSIVVEYVWETPTSEKVAMVINLHLVIAIPIIFALFYSKKKKKQID